MDANSKLSNSSTSTLRSNIATYLADYRMINDYVSVTNGKVINLGFEIDVFIDRKVPQSQIAAQIITNVENYLNINNFQMGESIFLSPLVEQINNVGGVLNVVDLRVYNKVGENLYSLNEISQPYLDPETRQIDISNGYTLFGDPISMFEIKYPDIDIKVRVRT